MVTDRLVASVNWNTTHINSITANSITAIRTPMHFATDRECLEKLALSCGVFEPSALKIARIRNTMLLDVLELSETLRDEVEANPSLEILTTRDWEYGADGMLPDSFGVEAGIAHG